LRKSLFFGLTLVLVSVFIYLAVQGYKRGKEQQKQNADVVETFKPTPVRALQPQDLEITAAFMKPYHTAGVGQESAAEHRIEIHNSGEVTYAEIRFKLDYLDASGAKLDSLFQQAIERVPPGNTVLTLDVLTDTIPADAADFDPTIVYADIESVEP